jgi:hypothetical protein
MPEQTLDEDESVARALSASRSTANRLAIPSELPWVRNDEKPNERRQRTMRVARGRNRKEPYST